MKKKFIVILVTILGLLSVFSVGFASWIVTKPMESYTSDETINTVVYEAYDNAKYIEIKDFTLFEYYNTGFVNNNTEITNTGKVIIDFKFNVNEYKNYLLSQGIAEQEIFNETIVIDLMLKQNSSTENLNLFNSSLFDFSYQVEENKLDATGLSGNSSSAVIFLNSLPNSEYVEFSVIYNITYKGTNFKLYVFPYIKDIRFAIEAKITRE